MEEISYATGHDGHLLRICGSSAKNGWVTKKKGKVGICKGVWPKGGGGGHRQEI